MYLRKNPAKLDEILVKEFKKNSANIAVKDSTRYTNTLLATILFSLIEGKKIGLKNKHFLWLTKLIFDKKLTDDNLKEDYLPVLKTFISNENLIKTGKLKEIDEYKNISELNKDIREISVNSNEFVSEEDLGIFFESGDWIIALPRTEKASIFLGKDTVWCTARTQSDNYFSDYVSSPTRKVILFYLINTKSNPRKDRNAKISVAFKNGKVVWGQGMTVDSLNNEVSHFYFEESLGKEIANLFLSNMRSKVKELGGEHPERIIFSKAAMDYEYFADKFNSLNNDKEKKEFIKKIVEFKTSDEVAIPILSLDESIFPNNSQRLLSENKTISEKVMLKMIELDKDFHLIYNKNIPEDIAIFLFKKYYEHVDIPYLASDVKRKNNTSSRSAKLQILILEKAMISVGYKSSTINNILEYTKFEEVMLFALTNGHFEEMAKLIIKNPNITRKVKEVFLKYRPVENLEILAQCKYLEEDEIIQIIEDSRTSTKYNPIWILAENPSIPNHILAMILNLYPQTYKEISKNPRIKPVVDRLVKEFIPKYLESNND